MPAVLGGYLVERRTVAISMQYPRATREPVRLSVVADLTGAR